jgi:hypothetical protein
MGTNFRFTFRHRQQTNIVFTASFEFPNALLVQRADEGDGIEGDEKKRGRPSDKSVITLTDVPDNAWNIFYEHATFEDILSAVRTEDKDDWLITLSGWVAKCRRDSQFLSKIATQPDLLREDDALERFIEILKTAKHGAIKGRKQAKENLHYYLIPGHHGGKKDAPSIKHVRYLLSKLSGFLSTRCRQHLQSVDQYYRDISDANFIWNDSYSILIKWAIGNEERIAFMSSDDLKLLIIQPTRFAEQVITRNVGISRRTQKRRATA